METIRYVWQAMCDSFVKNPRDVVTVPKNKKGKWFYVYSENGNIFIQSAKEHGDSCLITGRRRLEENKLDIMLDIYYKRCRGESFSKEATQTTRNQVYWFGIFADLGV